MDQFNLQSSPRRIPGMPNGHGPPQMRPGMALGTSHPGTPEPSQMPQAANGMSRAERFEDEKQRIMKSCFSRRDEKGQLLQSYITHIRVEEDAMHPSDVPPLNADPACKKSRAIMVAVKNTGRVYMHKARENQDGTFQIGKSWPLEELAHIESFSGEVMRTPEDTHRAQLAGPAGMVITMGKPYYWKAMTPKEKDFFLASLVKIYRKYTSGQVPKLKGFASREESEILGQGPPAPAGPPAGARPNGPPPGATPPAGFGPGGPGGPSPPPPGPALPGGLPPPLRPDGGRGSFSGGQGRPMLRPGRPSDMSADPSLRSASNDSMAQRTRSPSRPRETGPGGFDRTQTPPQPGSGFSSRLRPQPSQDSGQLRSISSRENMNGGRLQAPNFPPNRISPSSSQTNLSRPSLDPALDAPLRSPRYPPGPSTGSPEPLRPSQKGPGPESMLGAVAATQRLRSPTLQPPGPMQRGDSGQSGAMPSRPSTSSDASGPNGLRQALPERRRPPLEDAKYGSSAGDANDALPRPLQAKAPQPQLQPQPQRSVNDTPSLDLPRMPGAFSAGSTPAATPPPPPAEELTPEPQKSSIDVQPPPPIPAASSNSRPSTPQSRVRSNTQIGSPASGAKAGEESGEKPGLGQAAGDAVQSPAGRSRNWNKALNAANTATKLGFKPRAGGAAGRLFVEKKETGEPDGITGVVPAPSTPLPRTDGAFAGQLDKPVGSHSASSSLSKSVVGANDVAARSRANTLAITKEEEPPPKPAAPTKLQESLETLGIDPALLGVRGQEYEATLANFGWTDNMLQSKTVEGMETSMRKEIAKLEAGGWLGYSDGKDERIEQFEKMIDRAIAECDEMEGLLTLYGVELSVRMPAQLFLRPMADKTQPTDAQRGHLVHRGAVWRSAGADGEPEAAATGDQGTHGHAGDGARTVIGSHFMHCKRRRFYTRRIYTSMSIDGRSQWRRICLGRRGAPHHPRLPTISIERARAAGGLVEGTASLTKQPAESLSSRRFFALVSVNSLCDSAYDCSAPTASSALRARLLPTNYPELRASSPAIFVSVRFLYILARVIL